MNDLLVGAFLTIAVAVVLEAMGLDLSRALVRAWVWIYTGPVPKLKRDRRREELDEQLSTERGEHLPLAADIAVGYGPAALGLRTLWRLIKGMPADLTWAAPLALVRIGLRADTGSSPMTCVTASPRV